MLEQFKKSNCRVFPHYRGEQSNDGALIGDITSSNFYSNLEDFLKDKEIDIFINNAAIYKSGDLLDHSQDDINGVIETNLTSQILMVQKVYAFFKKKNNGIIVNINSLAGRYPSASEPIYSASKFGLRAFTESLQIASLGTNIKIINFYLGAMQTDMTSSREGYLGFMNPAEVAETICQLTLSRRETMLITEIVIRKFNKRGI
jgi:short-subunit dehydrogenase